MKSIPIKGWDVKFILTITEEMYASEMDYL